jgi:hypothetical protein
MKTRRYCLPYPSHSHIVPSNDRSRPLKYSQAAASSLANLMVDSVTIRNFRSFKEAKLDDCRRVNLLVGDNGSGKTAFLEALFLAAGVTPELAIRTRSWRGYEGDRMSGSHEDLHHALWADLFHRFQTNRTAFIALRGKGEQNRSVEISLFRQDQMRVIAPRRDRPGSQPQVIRQIAPFQFRYKIGDQKPFNIEPYFDGDKLIYPPAPATHVKASFFAANRVAPGGEVSNRFSRLSRTFEAEKFIERFTKLYPRIQDLSVEVTAGSPMLFAAVEGLPEKIPLTLASGGMSKLASILLAMPDQEGGLILVDEMENGFYHRSLPEIWKTLLKFATLYDCQLFLSTHSAECLESAAELARENPREFSIVRTVLEDGETKLRHLGGDKFIEALSENIDIR